MLCVNSRCRPVLLLSVSIKMCSVAHVLGIAYAVTLSHYIKAGLPRAGNLPVGRALFFLSPSDIGIVKAHNTMFLDI